MITTKKVKPTQKELFSILLLLYLKRRWWLFIWVWGLALIVGLNGDFEAFDLFCIVFAFTYPISVLILFWRHVSSKDNKILLLERYYEIDSEKINAIIDQDTYTPIKLEHFIKVEFIRETYLLFISKHQFVHIPMDSFESESDREWFENEIIKRIQK